MNDTIELWHWRREVSDLYGAIRAEPDAEAAHRHWQQRRRAMFTTHAQSAIPGSERPSYGGPHLYPYDRALRFSVNLEPLVDEPPQEMKAGADGVLMLIAFARSIGLRDALGAELTFYWIDTYGGGVFVPFRDPTNGRETYGGGRYLLDSAKGADLGGDVLDRVTLDFNFSYFPSCAYSDDYVCPLAPEANRLWVPVRAGERLAMETAG